MPKLLLAPEQRGWPHFQRLMIALLSFLEPYLRNADLTEAIRMLYKVRFEAPHVLGGMYTYSL